ncbi:hypothetical protein [Salinigranum marinum]|uniref:hypothetical protein n=1 Tax=Salinigranum marinum TaxID=1515595 RepID=UPI002989D21C|nr:hypothetical protein [Salinigranum marinum]
MAHPPGTNRHVPEFALVTGAFLSLSALVAGVVLTGDVVRSLLTAVVILYPFTAYAVTHSDDPTGVLPPRVTSVTAAVVGVVLAGSALVAALPGRLTADLPYALVLGATVVLPPAAYHVRYGERADRVNPLSPIGTVAATTVVAVAVLGYGLLVGGAVFAAATALLTFLAGAVYARGSGARLSVRTRRRFVAGGAVTGVGVALVGLVRGSTPEAWLLVGLCVVAAPTLFYALTAPERV